MKILPLDPNPENGIHVSCILVLCISIFIYGCFRKWWYPRIIHVNRDFHYKSSILGYPYSWKHPYTYGCGSKCKVWIKPRSHTRSRPLIQTSDPDHSKGFDPDLWSRPLEWYNVLVSWCLVQWWLHVFGFPALQLFTLPSSQATNCCKATLPSSQEVQQPSCNCCASKLSNCQADTVASCKASLPSSQAVHLLLAHLVVLFLSCCIQAATYTNMWVHFRADPPGSRPIQTRSRPQPAPIQTTTSFVLKLVIVWFLSFLQTLGSQSINFGTHVNGSKSAYSQIGIRSVNTIPGLAGIDLSTFPCDLWSSHRLM